MSLGVIFVAELGDKSQLLALTFALRYRAGTVIAGIAIATGLIHLASVALGASLGALIPTAVMAVLAALSMIAFGWWTLYGDEDPGFASRATRSALATVISAFMLAELGDKTMLATVALASDHPGRANEIAVWAGSTIGMVLADALAIAIGVAAARKLAAGTIRIGGAVLFFVLGAILLAAAIIENDSAGLLAAGLVGAVAICGAGATLLHRKRGARRTPGQGASVPVRSAPLDNLDGQVGSAGAIGVRRPVGGPNGIGQ